MLRPSLCKEQAKPSKVIFIPPSNIIGRGDKYKNLLITYYI